MTPAATPEALEQALAYLKPHETNGSTISLKAPKAREAVAVIEAALHRFTAEKRSACLDALAAQDQAAENDERARTAEATLATATAEAASLRAEVEALKMALHQVKSWIDTDLPAGTSRAGTLHRVVTKALDRTALARAGTAREGRSDA